MDKIINKTLINKHFKVSKLSKDDFKLRQNFVINFMSGCGYDLKDYMDFVNFNKEFKPKWDKLYNRKLLNPSEWGYFENGKLLFETRMGTFDNNIIEENISEYTYITNVSI